MGIAGGVVTYLIIWWIVLFAVLPLGVRSQWEDGEAAPGTEPGAPVAPNLWRKALWTTLIAAGLWVLVFLAIRFEVIPPEVFDPNGPGGG